MSFISFIESLSWNHGVVLLIAFVIGIASMSVLVSRRVLDQKWLRSHQDVAGLIFAYLGVLYSVLLGFTVVNVQQRFNSINANVQIEASYIGALYRDSEIFPEFHKQQIRKSLINYAQCVISDEWSLMSKDIESHMTKQAFKSLWQAFYNLTPNTIKEQLWYAESIGKLNALMQTRVQRLTDGKDSLSFAMWILLISGAVIMVGFVCLFAVEKPSSHIALCTILAIATGFMLFLIYSLDSAFTGQITVSPQAIANMIKSLQLPINPS